MKNCAMMERNKSSELENKKKEKRRHAEKETETFKEECFLLGTGVENGRNAIFRGGIDSRLLQMRTDSPGESAHS